MLSKVCTTGLAALMGVAVVSADVITFGAMIPFTGWPVGPYVQPAVKTAVDGIHASGIIAPHTLQWIDYNDDCDGATTLVGMHYLHSQNVSAVIGPACSVGCEPGALVAAKWDLPHISWGCTTPVLSDAAKYPTFARTVCSTSSIAPTIVAFTQTYQWRRVAFLNTKQSIYAMAAEKAKDLLEEKGISVLHFIFVAGGATPVKPMLEAILHKRIRVTWMFCYGSDVRNIMLTALDLGMVIPGSGWINVANGISFSDAIGANGFMGNDGRDAEALGAFEGMLVCDVSVPPITPNYNDFLTRTKANFAPGVTGDVNRYAAYLHRAIWLYAHALNKTFAAGKSYDDGSAVVENVKGAVFEDLTGPVAMDDIGDAACKWAFINMIDGTQVNVPETVNSDGSIQYHNLVWTGNQTMAPRARLLLGAMIPWSGWPVGDTISGALPLAVDHVNADGILGDYALEWITFDDQCDPIKGVEGMFELRKENVDAIIGPGCSTVCVQTQMVAATWDIPQISYGCQDNALSEKQRYPTFARTTGPSSVAAPFMRQLLQKFEWSSVALLAAHGVLWATAAQQVGKECYDAGMTVFTQFYKQNGNEKTGLMQGIKERGIRVVVLFAYTGDIRAFLLEAYDLGMLEGYAFVTFVPGLTPDDYKGDGTHLAGDGRDADALFAFQGLLSMDESPGQGLEAMKPAIRSKMLSDFNVTVPVNKYISPYASLLYDSVWAYAHAVNSTLSEGNKLTEGRKVAATLFGTEFSTETNGRVVINDEGDRIAPYEVVNWQGESIVRVGVIEVGREYNEVMRSIWPGNTTVVPSTAAKCPKEGCGPFSDCINDVCKCQAGTSKKQGAPGCEPESASTGEQKVFWTIHLLLFTVSVFCVVWILYNIKENTALQKTLYLFFPMFVPDVVFAFLFFGFQLNNSLSGEQLDSGCNFIGIVTYATVIATFWGPPLTAYNTYFEIQQAVHMKPRDASKLVIAAEALGPWILGFALAAGAHAEGLIGSFRGLYCYNAEWAFFMSGGVTFIVFLLCTVLTIAVYWRLHALVKWKEKQMAGLQKAGSKGEGGMSKAVMQRGASLIIVFFLTWIIFTGVAFCNYLGLAPPVWMEILGAIICALQPIGDCWILFTTPTVLKEYHANYDERRRDKSRRTVVKSKKSAVGSGARGRQSSIPMAKKGRTDSLNGGNNNQVHPTTQVTPLKSTAEGTLDSTETV